MEDMLCRISFEPCATGLALFQPQKVDRIPKEESVEPVLVESDLLQKIATDPDLLCKLRFIGDHVSDHRFLGEKQVLLFQDHYGLTQAEGKLLLKLGNGKTLNSIADSTGVSVHTLRTQIKSIFEKTDTHSQNQLIQLLLTGIG